MINTNIKTNIAFGGFYHSYHQNNIDHMIEAFEYEWDKVNYEETFNSYIDDYANKLSSFILSEYKIEIDFKNIKLNSPKYYNYSTDVIDCEIDSKQVMQLNQVLSKDDSFLSYLKDRTISYDGYISFYNYNEALSNKDDILILYVLEYVSNEFNEKYAFYGDIEFEVFLLSDSV
tara:strand:- start:593 stop:1114 length:522 start_codon:yes stop_codon:yes gene_type:complete